MSVEPACDDLSALVKRARTAEPVPVDDLNDHWRRALSLYRSAAASCSKVFRGEGGAEDLVDALGKLLEAAPELKVVTTAAAS